jgi:hypothetical protein
LRRLERPNRAARLGGSLLLVGLLRCAVAFNPRAPQRRSVTEAATEHLLIMDDDQNLEMQRFLPKTNAAIGSIRS